jgi:catechol 2,3-dioxygenase-like lactoylglutathione lyase family enzyme
MALKFTHLSIPTSDADKAAAWYRELFGFEDLPAPNFGRNVRWLKVGGQQLHLYERDEKAAPMQHFGVVVDDFAALFRKAQLIGALDDVRGHHLYITPAGEVQLYLRDPDGNNLEVNWPDASTLPETLLKGAVRREDAFAQSDRNRSARIFMDDEG